MNYKQFRDYVMAQPTDRRIDHSTGWCGCAVGDAYFHHHPESRPEGEDIMTIPGRPELILETWRYDERIPLYRALDENGHVHRDDLKRGWQGPRQLTTYGHLQDYIKFLGV